MKKMMGKISFILPIPVIFVKFIILIKIKKEK